MSDVKWIKITTDIFDDEKILLIESLPSADSIITIWFKLLALAGKQNNNGVFMMNDKIPYTDEMLAVIFRRELNTVRLALDTFERFGMIDVVDNVITIPNWNKHQTLDSYEKKKLRDREYQRERREQQRIIAKQSSDTSLEQSSDICVSDIEEDKEIEEDKDTVVSNDTTRRTQSVQRAVDEWNALSDIGIKSISKMASDSTRYKMLTARIKQYGIDEVIRAMHKIRDSGFLQGGGKKGWMITFDWFVRPNNFPKVLDGQYDNNSSRQNLGEWGDL